MKSSLNDFKVLANQIIYDKSQREYNRLYKFIFGDTSEIFFSINDIQYLNTKILQTILIGGKTNTKFFINSINPKGYLITKEISVAEALKIIEELQNYQLNHKQKMTSDLYYIRNTNDNSLLIEKINKLKAESREIEERYSNLTY